MRKVSGAESVSPAPACAAPVPPLSRWWRWLAGLAAAIALTTILSWDRAPYLHRGFAADIVFPTGIENRSEPLLCTGRYGAADFLVLNYTGEKTATISYDSWGVGGPTSAPFEFQPGRRHTLKVDLPSLAGPHPVGRELRPLRVELDGREILAAPVRFHPRAPGQIYFAENPIGGNTAWQVFRGRLTGADGRRIVGGHRALFRWPARLGWWLRTRWWEAAAVVIASIGLGLALPRLVAWGRAHGSGAYPARVFAARPRPPHAWFGLAATLCFVVFGLLVTAGTFRFVFAEDFADFYDYQARSLLAGRLDVPEEAIGGEAFVVNGKTYGYFGVTPALLRLPFVAAGVAFGQLSRVFLTGYFLACLFAGYLLLCHATRRIAGNDRWPSPAAAFLFTLSVGLGSTLFFLGARSYVYHEAILCGAAFALWSVYFALRYVAAPAGRAWIGALVCGVLAVQARPSSGLFALCALGTAALWVIGRHLAERRRATAVRATDGRREIGWAALRRPLLIGTLAAAGILSFNGMSYLKFRTFDGSPFKYSVQYTEERRAKFEGKNFHLANLPHNLTTYVLHPGFSIRPRFPYFFLFDDERPASPGARMDLEEPALAFPYAMPALFVLALVGGLWAAWWAPPLRPALGVLGVALIPMALALFTAVVTSHRYTGDFCPFFIACGALGMAAWDAEGRRALRRSLLGITGALTVLSIAITLAITVRFQGEMVWGVPEEGKRNYEQLKRAVDGFFGTGRK